MSIHRSLKSSGALRGFRNVFKRTERLQILKDQERWDEEQSVFGLPKVRTRFKTASAKKKEKEEATDATDTAAEGAATSEAPKS